MFAVCVTRLSARETKISTNVFADRSATLRHLGYICTIVKTGFSSYIYMYNIHTTRSLFYGLWESRVYENTYNVSTARFKNFQLVPTYHRVTSPQFSECIDKWEWIPIFDTVVVSTSNTPSVRRRKVDLPLLFWRKPCLSLKKGYLAYLGSWL